MTGRSALLRAVMIAPLLIAAPVLVGIVTSILRLHGAVHPGGAWSPNTNASATAFYLGDTIYQDPATGFTGGIFPPLLPLLTAAMDVVHYWSGWSLLLTLAGSVAVAGLAGVLAYRPAGRNRLDVVFAVAGAFGVAGLAWWIASSLNTDFLFDGRADQPSWALALIGLVLVPRGVTASWRACAAAVVLITAAIWTKQTAVLAAGVAVGWVVATVLLRAVDRRRALAFILGLGVLNGVLYLLWQGLTGGWFGFFLVEVPRGQAITATWSAAWAEFWRRMVVPMVILGALLLAVALSRGRDVWEALRTDRRARLGAALGDPGRFAIASIVTVFVVVAAIGAIYARRKQGTTDNQDIGVVWGLALLAALAWREATTRQVGALLAALLVSATFVVAQSEGLKTRWLTHGIVVAPLDPAVHWNEVPAGVQAYVADHPVYWAVQPDINYWAGVRQPPGQRRRIYPSWADINDLLAAGGQPLYLARALLDRRFDAVTSLPDDSGYASAYGKHEEGYLWKLNQIINARYAPAPGLPEGLLARIPGPDQAPWMRRCFGPFRGRDASFEIGHGGGFWCELSGRGSRVTLVDTPAEVSEIRTALAVDELGGYLGVSVPAAGTFTMAAGTGAPDDPRLVGEVGAAVITITQYAAGRVVGRVRIRRAALDRDSLAIALGAGAATGPVLHGRRLAVRLGPVAGRRLSLSASRGSRVTYDLARLVTRSAEAA